MKTKLLGGGRGSAHLVAAAYDIYIRTRYCKHVRYDTATPSYSSSN